MLRWEAIQLGMLEGGTRTNTFCVRELHYADDMALVATNYNDIQEIVNHFHSTATMFGLKINTTKTELMYQPHPTTSLHLRNTDMLINGEALRYTVLYGSAGLFTLSYLGLSRGIVSHI